MPAQYIDHFNRTASVDMDALELAVWADSLVVAHS